MSVSDDLMWQYYELLTVEDVKLIKKMHPKEAKVKLAHLLVRQYHGLENADSARQDFEKVFSKNVIPEKLEEYVPPRNKILLSHLLFDSGLSTSKRESKRLIANGGVRLDGKSVERDSKIEVQKPFVLQVGKRKFKKILVPLFFFIALYRVSSLQGEIFPGTTEAVSVSSSAQEPQAPGTNASGYPALRIVYPRPGARIPAVKNSFVCRE